MNKMNQQQHNDEIDLFDIFQTLWNGRLKIIAITIMFVIAGIGIQLNQPPIIYTFKTKLTEISMNEANQYSSVNSYGLFSIDPSLLLTSYIKELERGILFQESMRKFGLIDRNLFANDEEFNNAIILLSSNIKIIAPAFIKSEDRGINKDQYRPFWLIEFSTTDKDKWLSILNDVHQNANEVVSDNLEQKFLSILNYRKQERRFKIADIETDIENLLIDYDRKIMDRLLYLEEQSAIARKLEVAKNAYDSVQFLGVVSQVNRPFYLRGYIAIEEEIDLIKNRVNRVAFVEGLLETEQTLRAVQQDKFIERVQEVFALTPIQSELNFSAVSIEPRASEINFNESRIIILLAAVLGGLFSSSFVLISNAFHNRQKNLIKS